jgi:hypothetical protein
MDIDEIIREALRLPATARFEIVDQLMQSLDKPDPEIDRMWCQEFGALPALTQGAARPIPQTRYWDRTDAGSICSAGQNRV